MTGGTPCVAREKESTRWIPPAICNGSARVQSDQELMRRVAQGDEEAFGTLYEKQAPLLFSVIFHILQDGKEAEDTLQETFLRIWKNAASYNAARGSISTWSVMIARHRAIDKLRSRWRSSLVARAAIENLFVLGEYAEAESDRQTLGSEECEQVRNALRRIGELQREVILLAFFSGLTHTQIAQRLHAPLGTVKARIRRGLISLREALQPSEFMHHDRAAET